MRVWPPWPADQRDAADGGIGGHQTVHAAFSDLGAGCYSFCALLGGTLALVLTGLRLPTKRGRTLAAAPMFVGSWMISMIAGSPQGKK